MIIAKVAICIPTYNRANKLRSLLVSLNNIRGKIHNHFGRKDLLAIFVSDNCSTDETQEVCLSMPDVLYVRQVTNRGATWNFEAVMLLGEADFVWLLGDDDVLDEDGVVRLVQDLVKSPRKPLVYLAGRPIGALPAETTAAAAEFFTASPIREIGHISRHVYCQTHIKACHELYANRPNYYLYPHLLWLCRAICIEPPHVVSWKVISHCTADGAPRWQARQWLSDLIEFADYAVCLERGCGLKKQILLSQFQSCTLLKDVIGYALFGASSNVPCHQVAESLRNNYGWRGRLLNLSLAALHVPIANSILKGVVGKLRPNLRTIDLSASP